MTLIDDTIGQTLATVTEHEQGEIRHTFNPDPEKVYRVRLSGVNADASGAYHFNLPPVEATEGEGGEGGLGVAIAVGDQVDGVLEALDLIEQGIYVDDYQLNEVHPGDTIRVTMTAGPENALFLPNIVVLDGESFEEIVNSFDQETPEVSVTFTASEGVDYLISVSHLFENEIGSYTLSIESL